MVSYRNFSKGEDRTDCQGILEDVDISDFGTFLNGVGEDGGSKQRRGCCADRELHTWD